MFRLNVRTDQRLLRSNDPTVRARVTPYVSGNWKLKLCFSDLFFHFKIEIDVNGSFNG